MFQNLLNSGFNIVLDYDGSKFQSKFSDKFYTGLELYEDYLKSKSNEQQH